MRKKERLRKKQINRWRRHFLLKSKRIGVPEEWIRLLEKEYRYKPNEGKNE